MDLRQEILKEHSRKQCVKIVKWVGSSQQRFNQLFQLFLTDEYRVVQRASWPVSNCVIEQPEFIKNNFSKLLQNLHKKDVHNAVKRNSIRLLQYVDIPKKYHGQILEICFQAISSPSEPVAVKASSLTVLAKLGKTYPEILPELKLVIMDQLPYQSPAFIARAEKILAG